jgi:hypothetical protein
VGPKALIRSPVYRLTRELLRYLQVAEPQTRIEKQLAGVLSAEGIDREDESVSAEVIYAAARRASVAGAHTHASFPCYALRAAARE